MLAAALAEGAELRPLEPWQAAEFLAHAERVREEIMPWGLWAYVVKDEESARSFLQAYADKLASDSGRLLGIWVGGELAGGAMFRTFDAKQGVCEVGVWLGEAARGRGLVTRAVRLMADWAFGVRGMSRIEWWCDAENEPSIRAAKRIGFTYEGTARSLLEVGGERRDFQVWSMLAGEAG